MTETKADRLIREAARASAADSFGPYFADRVVRRALERPGRPTWRLGIGLWRPALVLSVLIIAVGGLDWTRTRQITGTGSQVTLPDGSSVTLAQGATITYKPFRLRGERSVTLDGEAFFDVESGTKAFVVSTFNSRIVVTGTRFNVRAWASSRQPETLVALEEGSVRVEPVSTPEEAQLASFPRPLTLSPGESARVVSAGVERDHRLSVTDAMSWQQGGLALIDSPLEDALAELQRRFEVRLEVDPAIANRPTTYVDPSPGSLQDVLDAICFALNLGYRPIQGGYRIEENPTK